MKGLTDEVQEGGSSALREPPDFLDSAITSYNLHNTTEIISTSSDQKGSPPQHANLPDPPPLPPIVVDVPARPTNTSSARCSFWQHRPCHTCYGGQSRCRPRGCRALPPLHLSSAADYEAPPARYNRIYSHVQSFGAYLQTVASSVRAHTVPINPTHPPKTSISASPDIYERKLHKARWAARTVGSFYSLSTFIALCSLTWATVVLLGAFVDDLHSVDYIMVTSLLLLEAIRLASAAFFTILLTHGLARSSQDPQNIIHGKDDHYRRALAARILSSLLQMALILPSFVCPIIQFQNIEYDNPNIYNSLLIFYLLIICNGIVSSITLFVSSASFIHLRDRYDQSILRYYDEILQRAISAGVIQADDFGFVQFAYRMLGSEFTRIVQPEAVVKNHRKLIEYLYRHRLGQDFLLIFLEADDAFVQQAAVNMAGFWADPSKKVGLEEVKLAKNVLRGMADKVGSGQLGWAAMNSFGGIARRDPGILAETRTSAGMPLLDRLAELVDGKSSGSLVYVRTLVLFYHYSYEKGQDVPVLRKEKELVGKLRELLAGARVQRARLFAAYLLHLLGRLDESCYDDVASIRPTRDTYWFKVELDLFTFIRTQCQIHEPMADMLNVPKKFVRNDDNFGPDGKRFL
ncbi:hypothetical protein L7F22_054971 [Adiantum nelumboides]|nr:hypothetical protein [Adiantum nelumboides]